MSELSLLEKARTNLRAAEMLADEEYFEISISRVYYTMFYIAEALLLSKGLAFLSHSAVIAAFGKEFSKTGLMDEKFHRYLIRAQELRNLGDYGVDVEIPETQVREGIEQAQEFLNAGTAFLKKK